jgi:CO/xanthine dehydrogenase FAD-binding subunit
MAMWDQYHRPSSLAEALSIMLDGGETASVIAGGTDLLLDIQQGRKPPSPILVDICGVHGLDHIEQKTGAVEIGAAVTHQQIVHNPLLTGVADCLVEACRVIGGPQVRNVATLGGNIAHGLPAADGTIGLLALGAEVELAGPDGKRWIALEELFLGPGKTILKRDRQILTRIRFPISRRGTGSAFTRVMRPQGVAIAILNLAVWLKLDDDRRVKHARIALGPSGPRPRRSRAASDALIGRRVTDDSIADVATALSTDSHLRTSRHRATLAYRRHLIPILLERALPVAYQRAAGAHGATAGAGG